jgi:hypothetical protein
MISSDGIPISCLALQHGTSCMYIRHKVIKCGDNWWYPTQKWKNIKKRWDSLSHLPSRSRLQSPGDVYSRVVDTWLAVWGVGHVWPHKIMYREYPLSGPIDPCLYPTGFSFIVTQLVTKILYRQKKITVRKLNNWSIQYITYDRLKLKILLSIYNFYLSRWEVLQFCGNEKTANWLRTYHAFCIFIMPLDRSSSFIKQMICKSIF